MKSSNISERETIIGVLSERLEAHDKSRRDAQEKLEETCKGIEVSVNELENRIGSELEEKFTAENNRLQSTLYDLQMDDDDGTQKAVQRAKAELLVIQFYNVIECDTEEYGLSFDVSSLCKLRTERILAPEAMEALRPTGVRATRIGKGAVSLQFTCLGPDEMKVLSACGVGDQIKYKCLLAKKGKSRGREYVLKEENGGSFTFKTKNLETGAAYRVRVKAVVGGRESEWSDKTEISEKGVKIDECEQVQKILAKNVKRWKGC